MLAFSNEELMAMADEYDGKFRTPTLRNIMVVPNAEFVKAYMHNGAIKTLKGAIELHNSRGDKKWDPPEFAGNMETELVGDMGLTNRDMLYIKAFLNTLTDGYVPRTKVLADVDEFEDAIDAAVITPTDFAFKLTGPNPFNPSTSFQLDLPSAESVKINVYNTLGQRVATLVNEVLPAGSHRVEFQAGNLATGLYLVSVTTPVMTEFRKIALVK
jgi:hypothetical protein